jgi:hypothetical protein
MRTGAGRARISGLVEVSVHILVDPTRDPISGWIESDVAPRHAFTGWLELTARLGDVVAPARASDPVEPDGAEPSSRATSSVHHLPGRGP